MKITNYTQYINEALNIKKIKSDLSDTYSDLKNELIDLINNTLEESDKEVKKTDLNNFFNEYITSGKNNDMIDSLIEDNDIFNFYLKYQSDFDSILNETGYMEKTPKQNNVYSLYDVIIDGTKQGIWDLIEIMQSELF